MTTPEPELEQVARETVEKAVAAYNERWHDVISQPKRDAFQAAILTALTTAVATERERLLAEPVGMKTLDRWSAYQKRIADLTATVERLTKALTDFRAEYAISDHLKAKIDGALQPKKKDEKEN